MQKESLSVLVIGVYKTVTGQSKNWLTNISMEESMPHCQIPNPCNRVKPMAKVQFSVLICSIFKAFLRLGKYNLFEVTLKVRLKILLSFDFQISLGSDQKW